MGDLKFQIGLNSYVAGVRCAIDLWTFGSIILQAICCVIGIANASLLENKAKENQGIRFEQNATSPLARLVQHQNEDGTWLNVCVIGRLAPAARIACLQLGYISGKYLTAFAESERDRISVNGTIYLVSCEGPETELTECLQDPETSPSEKNCTMLRVHCSDDTDIEKGVRLIDYGESVSSSGIVQMFDGSANEWVNVCHDDSKDIAARLIRAAFGMLLQDTVSEPTLPQKSLSPSRKKVKRLMCGQSAIALEDCWLDTEDRTCSFNITCMNYTGIIKAPVVVRPYTLYDQVNGISIKGINDVDLLVKSCSGLKIALATHEQSPLQDFTELEFGAVGEIQMRRCSFIDSCIFLDAFRYNESFECHQWMNIHLELDAGFLQIGIGPLPLLGLPVRYIKPLDIPHATPTSLLFPASTSHVLTYKLIRYAGMNKCYIRTHVGERFEQCGDAYVHKSLCLSCGCCVSSDVQQSCYQPIGFDNSSVMNSSCNRNALEMFGKVYAEVSIPVYVKRSAFVAIILQHTTPNISFGIGFGDGTLKNFTARKWNKSVVQDWIRQKLRTDSFMFQGTSYVAILKHTYNSTGRYSVTVFITDPNILKPPSSLSLQTTIEVKPLLPLKEFIGPFYLLSNGPSCAGCTVSMYVVSHGLTDVCVTTIDPGDGTGSRLIVMGQERVGLETLGEITRQLDMILPFRTFYVGILNHSYNNSGQFLARAVIREPDRKETDLVSASTIITIDLRPLLSPIIGTVALFNNGPVYQNQKVALVLIVEYLTPSARLHISEGNEIIFPDLVLVAGRPVPVWIKDEVMAYPMIGNRTDYLMIELSHSFAASGSHILECRIWDHSFDDIVTIHTEVIILQLPCSDLKFRIRGGGGTVKENALSLKQKDYVKLSVEINLDCKIIGAITQNWTITYYDALRNFAVGRPVELPQDANVAFLELFIPQFFLNIGYYQFYLELKIPTNNARGFITTHNQSWILMVFSHRLSLSRLGVLRNVAGLDSSITIPAHQLVKMDENEFSENTDDNYTYIWFCLAENDILPSDVDLANANFSETGGCFGKGLRLHYEAPVLEFKTDQLLLNNIISTFKFQVLVTRPGEKPRLGSHDLTVLADYDPVIKINCLFNCRLKFNIKEQLVLEAVCHKHCEDRDNVQYEWRFSPASSKNIKTVIDWETETEGKQTSRLVVRENVFQREASGESYSFVIVVTKPNHLMGSSLYSVTIPVEPAASIYNYATRHQLFMSNANLAALVAFAVLCHALFVTIEAFGLCFKDNVVIA